MKNVVCLMCAVCMSIFAVSCATTGPVAAAAPTEGSAARFFKVAVVP